jgi:hypothetical protein
MKHISGLLLGCLVSYFEQWIRLTKFNVQMNTFLRFGLVCWGFYLTLRHNGLRLHRLVVCKQKHSRVRIGVMWTSYFNLRQFKWFRDLKFDVTRTCFRVRVVALCFVFQL